MKLEHNRSIIGIALLPLAVLCCLALVGPEDLSGSTHYILGAAAVILVTGAIIALLVSISTASQEQRPGKPDAAISLVSLLVIGVSAAVVHFDWANQSAAGKKGLAPPDNLRMPSVFPLGMSPPGMSRKPDRAGAPAHPMQSLRAPAPRSDAPNVASPSSDAPRLPDEKQKTAREIDGLLARAAEAQKQNQFDEAEELYRNALSLIDSAFPDALDKRGPVAAALARTLFSASNEQNAIEVIDDHLKRVELNAPQDYNTVAQLHDLAGTFLGNANRFEESIQRFEKSLTLKSQANSDPSDVASTYAKIAISHARLNNKEKARIALKKSKELLEANVAPDDESLKRIESIAEKYDMSL